MYQHRPTDDLRTADRRESLAEVDPATGLIDDRAIVEAEEDAIEINGLELLGYRSDCPWWL